MKKEKVIRVCGGSCHTLILTQSKRVYSIGNNQKGQLGLGDNVVRSIPSLIDPKHFDYEKIAQICVGYCHSMALTQNGNVYSWGNGKHGQLGHVDALNENIPTKINPVYFNNEPIKYIISCSYFSFAVTKNNNLHAWGHNYHGQLGLGNNENQFKPTLVDPSTYNHETIVKIECGCQYTLLLTKKSNGSTNIYSCGSNYSGQLGLDQNDNKNTFQLIDPNHFANQKIKDIKAGDNFSLALIQERDSNKTKIYSWGSNFNGQLGLGDEIDRKTPYEIDHSNFNRQKIISIGNGSWHSFAIIKKQGSNKTKVHAWGDNGEGKLGLGHCLNVLNPNPINMKHFQSGISSLNSLEQIVSIGGNCGACGH